jgi:hypothetical protein
MMPPDHPSMLRGRNQDDANSAAARNVAPPPPAENAAADTAAGAGNIRGTIRIADKLADKAQSGSTLFLVARTFVEGGGGGSAGPVLAVQRYTTSTWPLSFELTQDNVMLAGMRLSGKVVLTARVDQDGDAMTKQAGDIEGTSPPITVPAQNVALVLDTVRTQAAGSPSPPGMGDSSSALPPGHPSF